MLKIIIILGLTKWRAEYSAFDPSTSWYRSTCSPQYLVSHHNIVAGSGTRDVYDL